MKTIEQIREDLNRAIVFPPQWEDWARGIEDNLNEILEILDYQSKVIAGFQNAERLKWEQGCQIPKMPQGW